MSWEVDPWGQDQCLLGGEEAVVGVESRTVSHKERRQFDRRTSNRLVARARRGEDNPARGGVDAEGGLAADKGRVGPEELVVHDLPRPGYQPDGGPNSQWRRTHAGVRRHPLAAAEELAVDDGELGGLRAFDRVVDTRVADETAFAALPAGLGAWGTRLTGVGWADLNDEDSGRWDR